MRVGPVFTSIFLWMYIVTETSKKSFVSPRSIFNAAVILISKGYSVFPLSKGNKKPATTTGFKEASNDPDKTESWFGTGREVNIGIATGAASGVWVLDIDVKNGINGNESLAALEAEFGKLPATLSCSTGSGGTHYYFKYDGTTIIKNSVGIRSGIDVRAEGGYVVAPPSIVNGRPYEWNDSRSTIAIASQWLVDLVSKQVTKPGGTPTATSESVESGSRNDTLMRTAARQMHKGRKKEVVMEMVHDLNETACTPPLEHAEVTQIVNNVFDLYLKEVRTHLTDMGNAEKMASMYRGEIRYVPKKKQWMEWDGNLWNPVDSTRIYALAKTVSAAWHVEADNEMNNGVQAALRRHAYKTENVLKIDHMIRLLESEDGIVTAASDLDKQAMYLPVKNGLVNLQTGQLEPANRDLLITHCANVMFDSEAKCPLWRKSLRDMMAGNDDLISFLQRAVGYTATTSQAEGVIFFLYGFGANGKSTFLNIVRSLMGDLGTQATGETLLESNRSSSGPSSDIARLRGKRFVAISEIDDGKHLAEARVKSLTGGDAVTARLLHENEITFIPQITIWVATNHKPVVKNNDHAIWRRIVMIPFEVKFAKHQQDRRLEAKLMDELPGILNWLIEGFMEWNRIGLSAPDSIERATGQYRSQMDMIGLWEAEKCIVDSKAEVLCSDAHASFSEWAQDNYNVSYTKNRFGRMMTERSYEKKKKPDMTYVGIGLRISLPIEMVKEHDKRRDLSTAITSVEFQSREDIEPELFEPDEADFWTEDGQEES
jgi:putative DNA primase/helicase